MTLTPVLSADAMRAADHATIERWDVPGRLLMETAGRAAVAEIEVRYPVSGSAITVLVGRGNNGGDGAVVARALEARGARVEVVALPGDRTPDLEANLGLLRALSHAGADLEVVEEPSSRPDRIVDALLGIGATGALREPAASLCRWANARDAPVVALDVPSGLDATTGIAAAGTIEADLTVAFGALKTGLLVNDGPRLAGEVVTVEIGIPDIEIRDAADVWTASRPWAGAHLPTRASDAHKYSAGRVLAVVGSRAFPGAAALASRAAYRAGAGAVVVATPASVRDTLNAQAPEVMVAAQPETKGELGMKALEAVLERAASADAVLVGCGLGRAPGTLEAVRRLVLEVEAPLVLDADGLAAFAGDAEALAQRDAPLVLTPHLGELRRLLDNDAFDPDDRAAAAAELAQRWDATLVVKGMPSIVGLRDGRAVIGPPGQPALATAGSGDTLAGTVTGLLAQGLSALEAAMCGLHLGSEAARIWTHEHGAAGMIASDVVERLPRAARALRS